MVAACRFGDGHSVLVRSGGRVLLVGDWFEPGGGVTGGGFVEDRVVAHHVVRGGAVPVLFPAGFQTASPARRRMTAPSRVTTRPTPSVHCSSCPLAWECQLVRAGGKPDQADDQARGAVATEDRGQVDIPGEVLGRSLDRCGYWSAFHRGAPRRESRAMLDQHVRVVRERVSAGLLCCPRQRAGGCQLVVFPPSTSSPVCSAVAAQLARTFRLSAVVLCWGAV